MGDPFDLAAGWLQEHLLIPALYQFGLMNWEDVSYGWALFALYGVAQVAVTFAVCLPLERWRPVERWPDSHAVWVDVAYTWRYAGSDWQVQAIQALSDAGVQQAGRYGTWHFQGIADSIRDGYRCGRVLAEPPLVEAHR